MAIPLTKPRASGTEVPAENCLQIGVSRPALPLDDLPTPEEVFKVSRLDWKTIIKYVLGPSLWLLLPELPERSADQNPIDHLLIQMQR